MTIMRFQHSISAIAGCPVGQAQRAMVKDI